MENKNKEKTLAVRSFFDEPSRYLQKRFGINLRRQIINELISGKRFENVMEVGCGDGSLSINLLPICQNLCLIDISDKMLDLVRKQLVELQIEDTRRIRIIHGDFHDLDISVQFDLVLCIGVLAHVNDIEESIRKLHSMLKEGGRLILQFTDSSRLMSRIMSILRRSNYPLNKIRLNEIERLANQYQFMIERRELYMVPFPGMRYFSDNFLFQMQNWILKRKNLGFLLTDYILLLQKKNRA